ncbi:MAG: nickel pincer cofactor biosynthesis protein LarC [Nitrospinota bacterium]|nr:nickel pincer cofactor biosynthesis protein LarC [Nitrospinota bacterium]
MKSVKSLHTAYFDCYSGISGDMILGALIDLGVQETNISKALKKIDLKGYKFQTKYVERNGIVGTQIKIVDSLKHNYSYPHRSFSDIKKLIDQSDLSSTVKKNSVKIFEKIAKVEARIHNTTIGKVHFHEIGCVDSIVDIVGSVWAIESLKLDKIYSSALNVGEGFVDCAHGRLPVPAPATLKLLKGIPVYSSGVKRELTTPTGAAIISFYAEKFQSMPPMKILKDGYGAGDRIVSSLPNFLRIILGEMEGKALEKLVMIETNIDDMNPEIYDSVMESLFKSHAIDVFFSSIQMKKNRPATKISVLSEGSNREALSKILLTETSSFGVRFHEVDRIILDREVMGLKTSFGVIKIKLGRIEGKTVQVSPEFEDCKKAARKNKLPVKNIYDSVLAIAQKKWLT